MSPRTDAQRDDDAARWNAALTAHAAGKLSDAGLANVKREVLDNIHGAIMTEDRYQPRTH